MRICFDLGGDISKWGFLRDCLINIGRQKQKAVFLRFFFFFGFSWELFCIVSRSGDQKVRLSPERDISIKPYKGMNSEGICSPNIVKRIWILQPWLDGHQRSICRLEREGMKSLFRDSEVRNARVSADSLRSEMEVESKSKHSKLLNGIEDVAAQETSRKKYRIVSLI